MFRGMAGTTSAGQACVSFKGRMMTLTVLEIRTVDCERIAKDVASQLARAPSFFARMPVLLSLPEVVPDLARLRGVLEAANLFVVGVLDADEATAQAAATAGLGTIAQPTRAVPARDNTELNRTPARQAAEPAAAEKPVPTPVPAEPARLVTKPVRSGQQVYARGGDLVVAASISEGAEVLADGHIHIYGALRGRALAGAAGNTKARIFCRRFEPDLVAIAGCYKVAEAIDEGVRSKAVQVRLDNDNLTIELQE
jgi:septum site-determining protein MinC